MPSVLLLILYVIDPDPTSRDKTKGHSLLKESPTFLGQPQ